MKKLDVEKLRRIEQKKSSLQNRHQTTCQRFQSTFELLYNRAGAILLFVEYERGRSTMAVGVYHEVTYQFWTQNFLLIFFRTACKVLASQYQRSKIQSWNFVFKLKFYYINRPLATRKWHQKWNWQPNKKFLLVKFHIFFLLLKINVFH